MGDSVGSMCLLARALQMRERAAAGSEIVVYVPGPSRQGGARTGEGCYPMKLFYSPASPYVRKVMVLLHETGQIDDVEIVLVKPTPMATPVELAAANPLGKLPSLQRDDGLTLFDSRVICGFLDARAGGRLYPQGEDGLRTKVLEALGDGMLDASIAMVYEKRFRPQEQWSGDWIEAQWSKLTRAFAVLEAQWLGHLAGPIDMGQVAVGCALGYVEFRIPDREWRGEYPGLARWFDSFDSNPSMISTRPKDP